jgi:hypothetical protein
MRGLIDHVSVRTLQAAVTIGVVWRAVHGVQASGEQAFAFAGVHEAIGWGVDAVGAGLTH